VFDTDPQTLFRAPDEADSILSHKTKFCAFMVGYADKTVAKRTKFFNLLSQYKRVDSGGRGLNNMGGPVPPGWKAKLDFLKPYKFHICFENNFVPGYTTEKLVHAMQARCLPIYWGNPLVHRDFNPESFLNLMDFPNEEALIERVIELDRDDTKYLEYHRQPYYNPDLENPMLHPEKIVGFFEKIFSNKTHPLASRRRVFSFNRWTLAKRNKYR
jgi:hypothetical protein